ncbi:MAG: hypothetical protein NT069_30925, partial [Planctomycetota bacterium]|nr:hypothetical protein [Planctomycetota bacterium]
MAQLKDDWEKIPTRGGKETVQTLRARRIFATLCLVALVTMFIYLFVPKSQLVRVVVQHYSSGGVDVGGIDAFAKPPINDWMTDTASKNVEIHTSTSTSADRSGSVPNSKDSLLDVVSAQCNSAGEFDTVLVLLSGTAELRLESPTFVGASDDQIKNVLKILRTVGKEGLRILCLDLGESVPRRNLATYQVAIENLLKSSVNTDGKAKPHEVAVILS